MHEVLLPLSNPFTLILYPIDTLKTTCACNIRWQTQLHQYVWVNTQMMRGTDPSGSASDALACQVASE